MIPLEGYSGGEVLLKEDWPYLYKFMEECEGSLDVEIKLPDHNGVFHRIEVEDEECNV